MAFTLDKVVPWGRSYNFPYSDQLSEDFHVRSIREMCRVAGEARIFPLLELGASPSRHIENVIARLGKEGFAAVVEAVPYEFQKGGDRMLKATKCSEGGAEQSFSKSTF